MIPRALLSHGFIALLALALICCKDDDPSQNGLVDGNHILVVQRPHHTPWLTTGEVGVVDLSAGSYTKLAEVEGDPRLTVRDGDDLYILAQKVEGQKAYSVLNKFNLSSRTITAVKSETMTTANAMVLHNGKLYIPGYDLSDESFLCRIDPATFAVEDTLHMNSTEDIYDVAFVGEQMFVNVATEVRVYTGASHQPSARITLELYSHGAFFADRNDNLLLPWGGVTYSIDPRKLSATILPPRTDDYSDPNSFLPFTIKPAFDKETSTLYAIGGHSHNSPYMSLAKIDLIAAKASLFMDKWLFLQEFSEQIYYSQNRKQLMVLGWEPDREPRIQLISLEGELIKEIPVDGYPASLIVE